VLKLIDFGLSVRCAPGEMIEYAAGTYRYMAPEILQSRPAYNRKVDLWSCGVIAFLLLCGHWPFNGKTDADIQDNVKRGYDFTAREWRFVSHDAKQFIRGLLEKDPSKRTTADVAMNHTWVHDHASQVKNLVLPKDVLHHLYAFQGHHEFKKAALFMIASQLDQGHVPELRSCFKRLDVDKDGTLSHSELKSGIHASGCEDLSDNFTALVHELDSDSSGAVDFTEFLAATMDHTVYLQRDLCLAAFCMFDKDSDGRITVDELRDTMASMRLAGSSDQAKLAQEQVEALMREVDINNDGVIVFEEFIAMLA